MNKAPNIYTINTIQNLDDLALIDNEWVFARPLGYHSLKFRIKMAVGVFFGKYDVLVWPKKQ